MRNELGKECRKLFSKMMMTEFSEYREDKGQIVPPGRYVWTCQHPSGIWLHILLIISQKSDKFTIGAAWDFDGKLPGDLPGVSDIFDQPRLFRVNFIWSGKDYWWPLVLRPEEFERALLYKDDPVNVCRWSRRPFQTQPES
ncbi:MAG TPA: hypothetical protein VGH42_09295 [Verrucomicrobiae bacterium]|jgi:hypothetical protein